MNAYDSLLLAFVCKSAENLYFCRSVVWPGEAFCWGFTDSGDLIFYHEIKSAALGNFYELQIVCCHFMILSRLILNPFEERSYRICMDNL